jgi:putative hydrolase of the HAD superfamily
MTVPITNSEGKGIQGIVFDAVGTLIEPAPSVAAIYAEAARRQGVEIELATVKLRFHQHFRNDEVDEAKGPLVTDEAIEHRRWRRIVGAVLPEVPDSDRAFGELWDHFGRADSWRCFADVAPALRAFLGRGLQIRIGSNFDSRLRAVVAGLPELAGCAEAPVISSEVGFRKPHPDFYRAACAALGLPSECVLCVGDDPENDVRGARRAGLRGLLLDRHGLQPDDLPFVPNLDSLVAAWPV